MVVSPVMIWTIGAVGAAIIARLIVKEWQRTQDELLRARTAPVPASQREAIPRLQRDPVTGVYRPTRD
jgi:hypothetical protein